MKNQTRKTSFLCTLLISTVYLTASAQEGTVETITYNSTTQNTDCNMNVYFPAGYNDAENAGKSYPVFYLIHGGGENYTHWINSGEADHTLDAAIASGEAEEMILVMPDAKNLDPAVFANEILNDIVPYMESNYRVIADKDHRAIGGLSWGGLQAMELGIYHYEMFGYLSVLSSGWYATDNAAYSRAASFFETNGEDFENSMRYFYFSEGTYTDIAYENGLKTLQLFKDYDLTVHYWEHTGGHGWFAWKQDLQAMVPYLFRDSTTVYVALDFQGGNIGEATIMTKIDSLIDPPVNPTRKGHSFAGWFKEPECIDSFNFALDTIKQNTTIYANWNVRSYKVSFNSNGGSEVTDTITTEYNTLIDPPADPVREDHIFEGWYTTETFAKKWNFESDPVTQNMTLIARWLNPTATIDYNASNEILAYPNPATSNVQMVNLKAISEVRIYTRDGKLVVHRTNVENNELLDIENLPAGTYTMQIKNTEQHYQTTLLIEN